MNTVLNTQNQQYAILPDYLKVALAQVDDRTNGLYSQAVFFLDRSFATMRYLIFFGCMLILLSLIVYISMGKENEAFLSAGTGVLLNLISVFQNYSSKAGSRFERFQNVSIGQNNLILAICMASQLEDKRERDRLISIAIQALMNVKVYQPEQSSADSPAPKNAPV